MADLMDIITGISQVIANSYDGASDEDGKPLKTGLKRDKEVPFKDKRVIDGFGVKISGDKLRLVYQSEALLSQVHDKKFEDEVLQTVSDVVSFIKKEYKRITGNALSLKEVGKPEVEMQNLSRARSQVIASCMYEIGGIDTDGEDKDKKDLDTAVKKWLETGKEKPKGAKKPENDER